MLFCIHVWLQLVLDLIVGAITVVIVATMTSMKDRFAAGSIGVALNLTLTLNQSLAQMIKSWTSLEMSIGAVSRVRDFVKNTPSESGILMESPSVVLPEWPSRGAIEFIEVSASYRYVLVLIQPHSNNQSGRLTRSYTVLLGCLSFKTYL